MKILAICKLVLPLCIKFIIMIPGSIEEKTEVENRTDAGQVKIAKIPCDENGNPIGIPFLETAGRIN